MKENSNLIGHINISHPWNSAIEVGSPNEAKKMSTAGRLATIPSVEQRLEYLNAMHSLQWEIVDSLKDLT